MAKNLGQYKQELQTRECLVQAIYQYIFNATPLNLLVEQFLAENSPKKINIPYFKQRLKNIFEQSDDLKEITRNFKNTKSRIYLSALNGAGVEDLRLILSENY